MKITIETSEPDDERKLRRMFNADAAYAALNEIRQEIFRPARKHGYQSSQIANMIEKIDSVLKEDDGPLQVSCEALIGLLEDKYGEIISESGLNLDE